VIRKSTVRRKLDLSARSDERRGANPHDEFAEINKEIKRLEAMVRENCEAVQLFEDRNKHLKNVIEQLKEKRREAINLGQYIRPPV